MEPQIYILGTADTKSDELLFLRSILADRCVNGCIVDISTSGALSSCAEIAAGVVAAHHPEGAGAVFCGDRGRAIAAMSEALRYFLPARGDLAGVLAIGGSGGAAVVASAMQALPIGLPKILVSTVASGNVAPYVGDVDLSMVYSVVDLQGMNRISRAILTNAANAMAGMVRHRSSLADDRRPAVGITMFGVTTRCVSEVVRVLGDQCESLVFHATGTGGRSMERLVDQGVIRGVLDITTTEFCDFVAGGIFSCGAERLEAVARTGVPYVGSCGGLDMVNFGTMETVPERYRDRVLVQHNPFSTLMRTNPDECCAMGRLIGERLNRCNGPAHFYYPEKGFSELDSPGKSFFDPVADEAFRDSLLATLRQTERRRFVSLPCALNDPAFAHAMATDFITLLTETLFHAQN